MTMSRYEATQYQRKVEAAIRRDNMASKLANDAGAITDAGRRAKELTSYYKSMSREVGLTTRIERTKVYTLS